MTMTPEELRAYALEVKRECDTTPIGITKLLVEIVEQITGNWDNIVLLTRWMADNGCDADEIAYAVEKPWKYNAELLAAKEDRDAE